MQDVGIGRRGDGQELKIQGLLQRKLVYPLPARPTFPTCFRSETRSEKATGRLVDRTETNASGQLLQCCRVTGPG